MRVPLVDLRVQYDRVGNEVERAWKKVCDTTAFVLGPEVAEFESSYSEFCGVDHCAGVANGGDALEIALRALGIGFGDEVILPANTFAATAMAVAATGATPVVVDCDARYKLIDPSTVEAAISTRTRALIPVHLYGQMAPMDDVMSIARDHDLLVVEDGAQSQGATQHGRHPGALSDAVALSFYPGKNLGAFGDGGAILTRRGDIAQAVRRLRNYGGTEKYEHSLLGRNSRLDSMQAAVLNVKLKYLDEWNSERAAIAEMYSTLLSDVERVVRPEVRRGNQHVWHLYVIEVDDRESCLEFLHAADVMAGVHYPQTIDCQPAFSGVVKVAASAEARRSADRVVSLPIYPGMTVAQTEYVADVVRRWAMTSSGRRVG